LATRFLRPLPTSLSHEPTHSTHKSPSSWSPLHHRLQQALNPPPSETNTHAFHPDADNAEPFLITSEPSPKLAKAFIGQSEDSPEIPKTPAAAVESVQHEEDNHSDDGISLFQFCRLWVVQTNKILGKNGLDREIQTPYGASTLPGDRVLEINGGEPFIRETSP
jgi:hypothetical protein